MNSKKMVIIPAVIILLAGCGNPQKPKPTTTTGEAAQLAGSGNLMSGSLMSDSLMSDSLMSDSLIISLNAKTLSSTPSADKGEGSNGDESSLYDLDKQYAEDIENAHGITYPMINLTYHYANLWKNRMDWYYGLLQGKLDEDGKSKLLDLHLSWEVYIGKDHGLKYLCNSYEGGGTSLHMMASSWKLNDYRDRAIVYADLYNGKTGLQTNIEQIYGGDSNGLDKEFKMEFADTDASVSKKVEVLLKYSRLWENEMKQNYNLLVKKMGPDDSGKLVDCQKAWVTYTAQNTQFITYCDSLFHYGIDPDQQAAELEYQQYRERALELADLSSLF